MNLIKNILKLTVEIFQLAWKKKIWWIIPVFLLLLAIILLVVVGETSAPFIYTLF